MSSTAPAGGGGSGGGKGWLARPRAAASWLAARGRPHRCERNPVLTTHAEQLRARFNVMASSGTLRMPRAEALERIRALGAQAQALAACPACRRGQGSRAMPPSPGSTKPGSWRPRRASAQTASRKTSTASTR